MSRSSISGCRGSTATSWLAFCAQHPRLRLIALTGYGQDADAAAAREAGFDAHCTKPVTVAMLLDQISGHRAFPSARRAPPYQSRPGFSRTRYSPLPWRARSRNGRRRRLHRLFVQQPRDAVANVLQTNAAAIEQRRRRRILLAQHAEQEVNETDLAMLQRVGLVDGGAKDLPDLRSRRHPHRPRHRFAAGSGGCLRQRLLERDGGAIEDPALQIAARANQPEQDVFRLDDRAAGRLASIREKNTASLALGV